MPASFLRLTSPAAKEFLAELAGTLLLVFFSDAAIAQIVLGEALGAPQWGPAGAFWGTALGVTLAVLAVGGASGAHLNPAVTVALALVGRFPWRKMLHYMVAQYIGAFLGAALVYLVYYDALQAAEAKGVLESGGLRTAAIFATYPGSHLSLRGGFVDQVLGTSLLLFCVMAITDVKNMQVPPYLHPLYLGLLVLNLNLCLGLNCGCAMNPARDLGPRLFTLAAGWGGKVFTAGGNWSWVPVVATHLGAMVGAGAYRVVVENHWQREGEEMEDEKRKEIT